MWFRHLSHTKCNLKHIRELLNIDCLSPSSLEASEGTQPAGFQWVFRHSAHHRATQSGRRSPPGCKRGIKGCAVPRVIVFAGIGHFLIDLFVCNNQFRTQYHSGSFLAWTYTELCQAWSTGKKTYAFSFFVAVDFCSAEDHLLRAGIPLLTQQLLLRFGDV